LAIALDLAANGWSVISLVRDAGQISVDHPRIVFVEHDVRKTVPGRLLELVADRAVDLLVNNAGQGAPAGGIQDADPLLVLDSVDTVVVGPMRLVAALLPALRLGVNPCIVNVSSRLGSLSAQARGDFAGFTTSYAYKIGKAAQNMLTISLAQELGPSIRCMAVHPGSLETRMGREGASKSPALAARELRELVEGPSAPSPSFVSLGEARLDW
jgi:NAD(P)-dependent dehydrogenase (short-subunit alcohol dehydrogenase family)